MSDLVRKNLTMSRALADWVNSEAKKRGTSQSALMTNIIHEYSRQDNAMDKITRLIESQRKEVKK